MTAHRIWCSLLINTKRRTLSGIRLTDAEVMCSDLRHYLTKSYLFFSWASMWKPPSPYKYKKSNTFGHKITRCGSNVQWPPTSVDSILLDFFLNSNVKTLFLWRYRLLYQQIVLYNHATTQKAEKSNIRLRNIQHKS